MLCERSIAEAISAVLINWLWANAAGDAGWRQEKETGNERRGKWEEPDSCTDCFYPPVYTSKSSLRPQLTSFNFRGIPAFLCIGSILILSLSPLWWLMFLWCFMFPRWWIYYFMQRFTLFHVRNIPVLHFQRTPLISTVLSSHLNFVHVFLYSSCCKLSNILPMQPDPSL